MTGPTEIEDFEPRETDMVLFIRNGKPVLKTPNNDGDVIPDDCLILVGVAASWNDEGWRGLMLALVDRLADAGELASLMTRHSGDRLN